MFKKAILNVALIASITTMCYGKDFKDIFKETEASENITNKFNDVSNLFKTRPAIEDPLIKGLNDLFIGIDNQVILLSKNGSTSKEKTISASKKELSKIIEQSCQNSDLEISQNIINHKRSLIAILHQLFTNSDPEMYLWRLTSEKEQINEKIKKGNLDAVNKEVILQAKELDKKETSGFDSEFRTLQQQWALKTSDLGNEEVMNLFSQAIPRILSSIEIQIKLNKNDLVKFTEPNNQTVNLYLEIVVTQINNDLKQLRNNILKHVIELLTLINPENYTLKLETSIKTIVGENLLKTTILSNKINAVKNKITTAKKLLAQINKDPRLPTLLKQKKIKSPDVHLKTLTKLESAIPQDITKLNTMLKTLNKIDRYIISIKKKLAASTPKTDVQKFQELKKKFQKSPEKFSPEEIQYIFTRQDAEQNFVDAIALQRKAEKEKDLKIKKALFDQAQEYREEATKQLKAAKQYLKK